MNRARQIWRHPKFKRLSDFDRVMTLYCLDGPQTNRIGLFFLSMPALAEDLQRPLVEAVDGLQRLIALSQWQYHPATHVLWIPTWWSWYPPSGAVKFRQALEDVNTVPLSPLTAQFFQHRRFVPEAWHHVLDGLAQGVPSRSRVVKVKTDKPPTSDLLGDVPTGSSVSVRQAVDEVIALWNATVTGRLPKVTRGSAGLRQKIEGRLRAFPAIDLWRRIFESMTTSDWCQGAMAEGPYAGWTADLGYLVRSDDRFQSWVDRVAAQPKAEQRAGIPNCRHRPACQTQVECTRKMLEANS